MSNSLPPHGRQHIRLLCPSLSPGVCSNSCPLNQWCHPNISFSVTPSLPALNLSQHQGLFSESTLCIEWPKYWSFSFSISPSNEYSGLISFRIDWLDLLAVQGTLKSLLQHHSSKASILQGSAFFMVQLLHPYMTTGKTTALASWTFVSKVMSLLFNTLSRFVIAFLLRSECLLISWLQSPSTVILEPKKIKPVLFPVSSPLPWSDGQGGLKYKAHGESWLGKDNHHSPQVLSYRPLHIQKWRCLAPSEGKDFSSLMSKVT